MAKAQGKQSTQPRGTSARSRTTDAEQLAALRWLAMKIEQVSIEVFVTNHRHFGAIEEALRLQVKLLRQIGRPELALVADDCPAGFVLCRDGLCSPMCDDGLPPLAVAPRPRRARR